MRQQTDESVIQPAEQTWTDKAEVLAELQTVVGMQRGYTVDRWVYLGPVALVLAGVIVLCLVNRSMLVGFGLALMLLLLYRSYRDMGYLEQHFTNQGQQLRAVAWRLFDGGLLEHWPIYLVTGQTATGNQFQRICQVNWRGEIWFKDGES